MYWAPMSARNASIGHGKMHPQLEFATLDAFDIRTIGGLPGRFTAIYLDLSGFSGYRALLDLIALLRMYEAVLQPELMVVKSGGLKQFLERCRAWPIG